MPTGIEATAGERFLVAEDRGEHGDQVDLIAMKRVWVRRYALRHSAESVARDASGPRPCGGAPGSEGAGESPLLPEQLPQAL